MQPDNVVDIANHSESITSHSEQPQELRSPGWARVGLIAVTSLYLGGVATAWWYRKTLIRLRQAAETSANPQFGNSQKMTVDDEP
jgi:hypothetical protein